MPLTDKEKRSKNMRAIRSKGSLIEKKLCKALWARGFRYRKNIGSVFGKPDIAFISLKIAVFCDSEFWHGYNWDTKQKAIKSNRNFWVSKIEKNILRDIKVNQVLSLQGWDVLRFWGYQIINRTDECVGEISEVIQRKKSQINIKK